MIDSIIDRSASAHALRQGYCADAGGGDVLCAASGEEDGKRLSAVVGEVRPTVIKLRSLGA